MQKKSAYGAEGVNGLEPLEVVAVTRLFCMPLCLCVSGIQQAPHKCAFPKTQDTIIPCRPGCAPSLLRVRFTRGKTQRAPRTGAGGSAFLARNV